MNCALLQDSTITDAVRTNGSILTKTESSLGALSNHHWKVTHRSGFIYKDQAARYYGKLIEYNNGKHFSASLVILDFCDVLVFERRLVLQELLHPCIPQNRASKLVGSTV
jgi:hypothetical protein